MTYIKRDGKIYEQIISEREVDPVEEAYKLQSFKDALANDARELSEYETKIAEIESSNLKEELKETLKQAVVFASPSGVKQEWVDEQETKVSEISNLKK